LIRRGGAPSWAAAYVIIGVMGVSTPIILSDRIQFSQEIYRTILMLFLGLAPAAVASPNCNNAV